MGQFPAARRPSCTYRDHDHMIRRSSVTVEAWQSRPQMAYSSSFATLKTLPTSLHPITVRGTGQRDAGDYNCGSY